MATPSHIAIIMDGNGRWAKSRGKQRLAGHRAGADAVERVLGYCSDAGVKYLTLYAFSTENWKRPAAEVSGLMKLFSAYLKRKLHLFKKKRVRLRVIGRRGDLSPALQKEIARVERETAGFDRQLLLAVSYGGRAEIADAARRIAEDAKAGRLDPADIDEAAFANYLYAPDVPEPELIIRTSGEMRVSNFLHWECAYSEFYIPPVLWPAFDRAEFDKALAAYASRERRLGGVEAAPEGAKK